MNKLCWGEGLFCQLFFHFTKVFLKKQPKNLTVTSKVKNTFKVSGRSSCPFSLLQSKKL
eukprot:UN14460